MPQHHLKQLLVVPCVLLFLLTVGSAQTIDIFMHQWVSGGTRLPDENKVTTAYSPFYTTVNVTTGSVGTVIGSLAAYDVVYICELDFFGNVNTMNAAQTAVVQDYVFHGGHIVWVSENNPGGNATGSDNSITVINNLWGLNLVRTPGFGNPTVAYHGGGGPGGLTNGVASVSTTSSYDYFTGPASLSGNIVLAANAGSCTQSVSQGMAYLLPEPNICDLTAGTIILYGEVQMWSTIVNTAGHQTHYQNVANLHNMILNNQAVAVDSMNNAWIPNGACTAPVQCAAFPVDGLTFGVTQSGPGMAKLNWETTREEQNAGFEIQHREENTWFKNVGFKAGNGTTEEPSHYEFMKGNLVPGPHFFRLKQIDENGAFAYSEVREVEITESRQFAVHPSVWTNTTPTLFVFCPEDDQVMIDLMAMDGRIVRNIYAGETTASEYLEIPLSQGDLAKGTYWLSVKGRSGTFGKRILRTQ